MASIWQSADTQSCSGISLNATAGIKLATSSNSDIFEPQLLSPLSYRLIGCKEYMCPPFSLLRNSSSSSSTLSHVSAPALPTPSAHDAAELQLLWHLSLLQQMSRPAGRLASVSSLSPARAPSLRSGLPLDSDLRLASGVSGATVQYKRSRSAVSELIHTFPLHLSSLTALCLRPSFLRSISSFQRFNLLSFSLYILLGLLIF
ncbi:hypothetical protein HDK77DRAFT_430616 [Phyllosticta capitalensis]